MICGESGVIRAGALTSECRNPRAECVPRKRCVLKRRKRETVSMRAIDGLNAKGPLVRAFFVPSQA
jgi:hypothetical protein